MEWWVKWGSLLMRMLLLRVLPGSETLAWDRNSRSDLWCVWLDHSWWEPSVNRVIGLDQIPWGWCILDGGTRIRMWILPLLQKTQLLMYEVTCDSWGYLWFCDPWILDIRDILSLIDDHVILLGFSLHQHESLPVLTHLTCEALYLLSVLRAGRFRTACPRRLHGCIWALDTREVMMWTTLADLYSPI